MIYCKSLDKSFATKEELFRELKANEARIISLKRAEKYHSAEKGQISISGAYLKMDVANKAGITTQAGFVYPVINTTRYMDMHDDVHFDGLWKKSLNEQAGKIFYLSGHSMKIDDVIAWPEDVKAFTALIDWSFVGKSYAGQTEALIYEINEDKIKKTSALEAIKERRKVQGSVSMIYVKVFMGINDSGKDYAINKAYWDSHIDLIANKERAIELGYFFGVEEAKIHKEGSMVLEGSNDATEIIYAEESDKYMVKCESCNYQFDYNSILESGQGYVNCPKCNKPVSQRREDTTELGSNNEPSKDTQQNIEPEISPLKPQIDYKYLLSNLKN